MGSFGSLTSSQFFSSFESEVLSTCLLGSGIGNDTYFLRYGIGGHCNTSYSGEFRAQTSKSSETCFHPCASPHHRPQQNGGPKARARHVSPIFLCVHGASFVAGGIHGLQGDLRRGQTAFAGSGAPADAALRPLDLNLPKRKQRRPGTLRGVDSPNPGDETDFFLHSGLPTHQSQWMQPETPMECRLPRHGRPHEVRNMFYSLGRIH